MQLTIPFLLLLLPPFTLACSPGFESDRDIDPAEHAWLFSDYSVEDVSTCSSRCARSCTAPGKTYGACMGCARWKGNARGKMDLPPCSKPTTSTEKDGEYTCQGYGDQFWDCITRCPPGYTSEDLGRITN